MARRHCFLLRVRHERMDEYRRRHATVWPAMLAARAATGWRNYSLFLHDDGLLVGYVEADDLQASLAALGRTDVNARWQAEMAPFFTGLHGRPPDPGGWQAAEPAEPTGWVNADFLVLEEVFHLEDQLARSETRA